MIQKNAQTFEIEIFFDGACPLCRREIDMVRRWDRRGKLKMTDISAPEFQASRVGKTQDALMAEIHGRLPDGTWLTGVEVFRRIYTAVGCGPLVWISRLPLVSHLLGWSYSIFARHRLRWTGRCSTQGCGQTLGKGR